MVHIKYGVELHELMSWLMSVVVWWVWAPLVIMLLLVALLSYLSALGSL